MADNLSIYETMLDNARKLAKKGVASLAPEGYKPMTGYDAAANWGATYAKRDNSTDDLRNITGAADHRAYTRQEVAQGGILPALLLGGAIPAYNAAKKVGILEGGQDPSIMSMREAYKGVGEGLFDYVINKI
jgi:hypothetical protein